MRDVGNSVGWLIVGHGSVGAFIASRLDRAGASISVLDPNPRVPVVRATLVAAAPPATFAYAVSCVPPAATEKVAPVAAAALAEGGILFDWNTVAPMVKRRIAGANQVATVDVALLDTLDGNRVSPTLAVSGSAAERGAEILGGLGFAVSIVGEEVGDAAALKYLRSIFMKTLEAMSIEFASLASGLDRSGIVRDSIERNLGQGFVEFLDLLVATNRVHGERRASELADAVATFAAQGTRPGLAEAAVGVLQGAARAWATRGAPPPGADLPILTGYLRTARWGESEST